MTLSDNSITTSNTQDPALRSRLKGGGYTRLMRLENVAMVGALVVIGAGITNSQLEARLTLSGICAACLVVAAGNVVNDILDADLDAIGRPWRPIPSGRISLAAARSLLLLLSASSIGIAALNLTAGLVLFVVMMLAMAIAYSAIFKGVPLVGNIMVASQVACVPIFGALLNGSVSSDVIALSTAIFSGYLLFELAKTASDRWYDATGIRTLATAIGARSFCRVMLFVGVLHVGLMLALIGSIPIFVIIALAIPPMPILGHVIQHFRLNGNLDAIEPAVWVAKGLYVPTLIALAIWI